MRGKLALCYSNEHECKIYYKNIMVLIMCRVENENITNMITSMICM